MKKINLKLMVNKNIDCSTTKLHNCQWNYANDIRLHVLRLKKNRI